MDLVSVIVSLASGAVGGNAAAAGLKNANLGTIGNSLTGALGGGVASAMLPSLLGLASGQGGVDLGSLVGSVVGGGAGGAVLTAIVGLIKNAIVAKS